MRAIDGDSVEVVSAKRVLLVSSFALLSATAAAEDSLELVARYGQDGGKIDGSGIALRLAPRWSTDWGDWKIKLRPEMELTHFHFTGPSSAPGPTSLNEGAVTAHLRLERGDGRFGPYAEAGFGLAALSHDSLGGKEFSTYLQFTERVGLGVKFPQGWFVGWQYAHYSNASIKVPNDGIDLHQIVIGVSF